MAEEKIKPSYYSILPAEVRYSKKISLLAKLLYSEITALCDKEGYCRASNAYFAELYNKSITQISMTLQTLEKAGFIKIEINKEEGNLRKIYLTPLPKPTPYLKKLKKGYLRKLKENNINNNLLLYKYNNNEEILKMLSSSKQRHLRILAWYAKEKNIDFTDVEGKTPEEKAKNAKKKLQDFIKRHGKYASQLTPYKTKDILVAQNLAKFAAEKGGFDWTLSTVVKKIDQVKEYKL